MMTILASGCGPVLKQVTVASATEIFRDGMAAFYREEDLILAEQALASNLKLLEVFLEASPDNPNLLLQASQGFGAYTFAFVEDKITRHHRDPHRIEVHRERARRLYLRGREYGLRLLALRHNALAASLNADLPALRTSLARLRREDVPALFWTAYGWAGSIHWSLDRPEMLADLPRVLVMMDRVLELAGPTILMGRLFLADPYAIQVQDRTLFETQLRLILDAPEDLSPDYRLLNQVAKARARLLLERIDELFL